MYRYFLQVSNCLNEILDTCHNFALLVTQGDNAGPEWEIEQLEVIAKVISISGYIGLWRGGAENLGKFLAHRGKGS
jgi:hypothetical protein